MTLKEPIVEGAYYEREDGVIAPAKKGPLVSTCTVAEHVVYRDRGMSFAIGGPSLTRRVYIVPVDPAEVVAELRERNSEANRLSAFGYGDAPSYHTGRDKAFDAAADLVESMLGLARCGEGCDGDCELTVHGPTKAEAELAELRSKTTEVVAELRAKAAVADARHNDSGDSRALGEYVGLFEAADLVAEKLGVK